MKILGIRKAVRAKCSRVLNGISLVLIRQQPCKCFWPFVGTFRTFTIVVFSILNRALSQLPAEQLQTTPNHQRLERTYASWSLSTLELDWNTCPPINHLKTQTKLSMELCAIHNRREPNCGWVFCVREVNAPRASPVRLGTHTRAWSTTHNLYVYQIRLSFDYSSVCFAHSQQQAAESTFGAKRAKSSPRAMMEAEFHTVGRMMVMTMIRVKTIRFHTRNRYSEILLPCSSEPKPPRICWNQQLCIHDRRMHRIHRARVCASENHHHPASKQFITRTRAVV